MDVAVLHPRDCLTRPLTHPIRSRPNPNPNRSDRGKRSPAGLLRHRHHQRRQPHRTMVAKLPGRDLVMGQVKILKRGEDANESTISALSLPKSEEKKAKIEALEDLSPILCDSDSILHSINPDLYAGSAFFTSPPPSSLPLPAFVVARKNAATSDLRRILRLD
ncbi:uncharacterized protein LOC131152211 [Malania oleifera]|uniref:uncharacterized protein LOC131152211 n=1 Tax=Malania oleifera TaxID=397392 RepID=UPI0025AE8679|nr:uncharacterized protein LOC131152211 [Malania oleifera]